MNTHIRRALDELKGFMQEQAANLKEYERLNGAEAAHRFWNLWRADLMRQTPETMADYLGNQASKLAEAKDFGPELAKKYFADTVPLEDRRNYQAALIYACLEIDAAYRLKDASNKSGRREILTTKLNIWSLP